MRTLQDLPPEMVEGRGVDPAASRSLLLMAMGSERAQFVRSLNQ